MGIVDNKGNKLKVEISWDGTLAWDAVGHTWSVVSADSGVLDISGADRSFGEFKTHAGTIASYSEGGLVDINLTVVHRNATGSTLEKMLDRFDGTESEPRFFIRWAYDEGASGALRRTALVILQTNPLTGADPSSATPVTKQLTMKTTMEDIHRDAVA